MNFDSDTYLAEPVAGNWVAMHGEATAMAAGWAAEEYLLRLNGMVREDELMTEYINGGHHNDRAVLHALASKVDEVDVDRAEDSADLLVERHWDLVVAVAERLLAGDELDQTALASICADFGIAFPSASADSLRTEELQ